MEGRSRMFLHSMQPTYTAHLCFLRCRPGPKLRRPPPSTRLGSSPTPPTGYLDEQFCQVEDLQDETSPNFTEEVVSLFFKDSTRLMLNIEQAMEKYPRDFKRWDAHVQQLKGSCSSIGASRMKNECTSFRTSCGAGNVESCTKSLQKVKTEHAALRQKLESYFQLMRQAGPCGMATRPRGM
ncbi:hypothetical protein QOZ80_5AG0366150 [Eleusine coracana subsp. coracana]|nr:hypothetical protein QOZ80_5AG0366150 [Eleusine coracana subsp. coracana]